jgi:hypothetical protein
MSCFHFEELREEKLREATVLNENKYFTIELREAQCPTSV